MNGRAFRDDDSNPILELANQKNATNIYDPYWNVYNLESNSTVRLIVKNEQSAATNISHVSLSFRTDQGGTRLTSLAIPHAWAYFPGA